MKGLTYSDNFFPRCCERTLPKLTSVGSSHPSHPLPTASKCRKSRAKPQPRGGGFPGIPRPAFWAPPPSRPPAGVALPPACRSGGGGESSGGRSVFSAAAGWIVSIKVFFLSRSLFSGEQAEASVCSRRVRTRRTRSERKRPPAGLFSSSRSGPREEGVRVRPGSFSQASAPPCPPRSRPGFSEGISGPPARLGGPGAMLTRGLGNA